MTQDFSDPASEPRAEELGRHYGVEGMCFQFDWDPSASTEATSQPATPLVIPSDEGII